MTPFTATPTQPAPDESKSRLGRESDKRCPKCGATLLTNDYGQLWCSNVGSGQIVYNGCTYGLRHADDCETFCRPGGDCDCGYEEAHRDKATA